MKTTLLTVLLVFATGFSAVAQNEFKRYGQSFMKEDIYEMLLQRSKQQKTKAWLSLIGGAGLATVGMSLYMKENEMPGTAYKNAYVMATTGVAATLFSVPFFVSAMNHKKKARLLLKNEETGSRLFYKNAQVTAIGIQLPL